MLALAVFTSCEKMLEVDMPGNQIDGNIVFSDVQTANAALAGLYAGLWESSPLSGDTPGALLGYYTDDLDYFYTSTNGNAVADIYLNQQVANNSTVENYWNSAYQKIYTANAILEGVSRSAALPAKDRDRLTGEALLMRSLLYYYLEELFGSIPYVTTTDYKINRSLGKTTQSQVLVRLEQDVAAASMLLTDTYPNTERIFPNRKVAELLLAKVHCLQHQWGGAELLLKNILQSPLYTFQNDLTKVFDKSGQHILWQLKPKNPNDPTKEVQHYYFSGAAPALNALSSNLMGSFDSGDLRKTNWTAAVTVGANTWYRANKYKNRTTNPNEYSVVFRLEEVYLLLAEVLAQQDKVVEALPYVNKTRQRAGLAPLPATISKAQLLDEILKENRKEFFTEMGHRFFDLKRMNRLDLLTAIKPNWKSHHALWPIPQKELLLNPNLNPQNPGY
ncbi:RagB/SusD family nutrient uptake outer membrane protein [Chryseobacterium sp.]|nr:RagB/SusD family nutrient uptake outer membrane protein [Chryseobacterium sp.]